MVEPGLAQMLATLLDTLGLPLDRSRRGCAVRRCRCPVGCSASEALAA